MRSVPRSPRSPRLPCLPRSPRSQRLASIASVASALLLVAGCRGYKSVPIKGKLVSITPEAITVEVTGNPGMRVVHGTYVGEKQGEEIGADGKLLLKIPRKVWKSHQASYVQIAAERKTAFAREGGFIDVQLGVTFKSLDRLPTDADAWFLVVGGPKGGSAGSTDVRLEIDDEKEPTSTWVPKGENTFSFQVAATPGAEIDLAGKTYEIGKTGLSELELPVDGLWLGVRTDTLGGNKMRSDLAYVVRAGKGEEAGTLKLSLDHTYGTQRVLKVLRAIADGKTVPERFGKAVDATVLVTHDDALLPVGPDTKVGLARWVAIERNTVRKGGDCVYDLFTRTRKYDDVEVHVYETRSGKQVAVKKFALDDEVECPMFASRSDTFEWREKVENVTAWLEKASKSGWK